MPLTSTVVGTHNTVRSCDPVFTKKPPQFPIRRRFFGVKFSTGFVVNNTTKMYLKIYPYGYILKM